jgi:hypothetical protein
MSSTLVKVGRWSFPRIIGLYGVHLFASGFQAAGAPPPWQSWPDWTGLQCDRASGLCLHPERIGFAIPILFVAYGRIRVLLSHSSTCVRLLDLGGIAILLFAVGSVTVWAVRGW